MFWLLFIIVVTGVFLANRNTIQKNFDILVRRLSNSPDRPDEQPTDEKPDAPEIVILPPSSGQPGSSEPAAAPSPPQTVRPQDSGQGQTTSPRENPGSPVTPGQLPQPAPAQPKPAETRERNIYFTRIDNDGQILRYRVSRNIAVSDSPMQDALKALLAGPTAEERGRGIVSLIPQNTRILSIFIRGTTAYISFSEDFQFNTYGVEGYAAQIRQIVWTATEFPTVTDVQILIEGRRVDYLGEGIWIGSPINRQSL